MLGGSAAQTYCRVIQDAASANCSPYAIVDPDHHPPPILWSSKADNCGGTTVSGCVWLSSCCKSFASNFALRPESHITQSDLRRQEFSLYSSPCFIYHMTVHGAITPHRPLEMENTWTDASGDLQRAQQNWAGQQRQQQHQHSGHNQHQKHTRNSVERLFKWYTMSYCGSIFQAA